MEEAAAASAMALIARVDLAEMRGYASFRGSVIELDIISSVVAVIRKLEGAEKSPAEGLVWMKYERKQQSAAVTLRLSRLSREDIGQRLRLGQIRSARCIQSCSCSRLQEVDQHISCNNTFKV